MNRGRTSFEVLAVAVLLLSVTGCGRDHPASAPPQHVSPALNEQAHDHEEHEPSEHPWRSSPDLFREHLAKVRHGWTQGQLSQHAGPPDRKEPSQWWYSWHQKRPLGGHTTSLYYTFTLKDGRVEDVDFQRIVKQGDYE